MIHPNSNILAFKNNHLCFDYMILYLLPSTISLVTHNSWACECDPNMMYLNVDLMYVVVVSYDPTVFKWLISDLSSSKDIAA